MKLYITPIFTLLFFNIGFSQQYTWVQKASFPGTVRGGAVGFSIGDSGYVGTGFNTAGTYFNDFYKWDQSTNSWAAIAVLPATARYSDVGFSIGNFGFIGTGWSPTLTQLDDFWKYNPTTNSWIQVATFPGLARYTSSVSVLNGNAYFGLGYQPLHNDFWEYDPISNMWTQKTNFPGGPRQSATAFTLGSYVYFLTGNDGTNKSDMYRYDPVTNSWVQKASFPGAARYGAVSLEMNGKAVVGTGGTGSVFFTDFYQYNPATDSWCQIPDLPSLGRRHVATFAIGNKAYLCTGVINAAGNGVGDLWELTYAPATFSINTTPCNLNVSFTSQATNPTAFSWTFGDGGSGTLSNPSHSYMALGTYNVQLIVYYNCGTDTVIQQVTLNGTPATAQFNIQPTACSYNVSFNNTSANAASYQWTFGDGNSSTLTSPSHSYAAPGNYNVTLYAISACDTDTVIQNILIPPVTSAVAAYSFNLTPCTYTVNFTNQSAGATNYLWNFGDGNSDTAAIVQHTYSISGNYYVTLYAFSACDTDTISQPVNISAIVVPQSSFSFMQNSCDLSIQFNNTSVNAMSYSWSFGDGNSGTDANPTNVYPTAGVYNVTLTVYGPCDTVTSQQQVNVNTVPVAIASFTASTHICDSSVTIVNTSSGGISYQWDFGDGFTSTLMQPLHHYTQPGNYLITLTTANGCDTDVTQQNIVISNYTPVTAAFNFNVPLCSATVTFNNLSQNAVSYQWSFGDGTFSTNANPVHAYATTGIFNILLTANDSCKSDTITLQVDLTASALPAASFNNSIQPCDSTSLYFSSTSQNALSYLWNFGDGSTSSDAAPYHLFANPGSYTVILIATNNCGTDTFSKTLNIDSVLMPEASFSFNVTPCSGTVEFANFSINASSYLWDFGDGNFSGAASPSHIYTSAGTYSVLLIVNPFSPCIDSVTLPVVVKEFQTSAWYIPNCFTPNDDGLNDFFEIKGLNECAQYNIKIFNRWGQKIFESYNGGKNWDGTFKNNPVPEGVYFYIATINGKGSSGAVTLLR